MRLSRRLCFTHYSVNIKLDYENNLELDFPAVSFCNLNSIDYNKANLEANKIIREKIERLISPFTFNDTYEESLNKTNILLKRGFQLKQIAEMITQVFVIHITRDEISKISYNLDQLLVSCLYNNKVCSNNSFQHLITNNFGNCFTFNSGNNPDNLYKVSRTGFRNGLRLELIPGNLDNPPFWLSSIGILIGVHDNRFRPLMVEEGLRLKPGTEINIIIKRDIQ